MKKEMKKRTPNIQRSTLNIECGAASRSYLVADIQHRLSADLSVVALAKMEASCEGGSIGDGPRTPPGGKIAAKNRRRTEIHRGRADRQACPERTCPEQGRREQRRNHPKEPLKKRIKLSYGKYAIVDAEDYDRLSQYKWCAVQKPRTCYAKTFDLDGAILSMHRVVANAPKGLFVDHINHNGLDNRKSNLRLCTKKQNNRNLRPYGKTSRYKGVHWDKGSNKFRAKITYNGKSIHLGRFVNEDDAAKAYDKKARELFGEFAYLNFPQES